MLIFIDIVYVTRGYDSKYANNRKMERITCKYVNKNDANPTKVTYCPKSSTCVAVRVYKKSTSGSGWVTEEERMGCQTKKHDILKQLCAPKACYMAKLPLTKETDRLYHYCCCHGDSCNMFVLNGKGFENSKYLFLIRSEDLEYIFIFKTLVQSMQNNYLFT